MSKIFIAAHYNLNNGDRAVLEATVMTLKKHYPGCDLTVSAFAPEELKDERFRTVPWPVRHGKLSQKLFHAAARFGGTDGIKKFIPLFADRDYLQALREADLVLISGGHHLTDILGEATFYQLAVNYIIPLREKKKIILLPQSVGPAENAGIRNEIGRILNRVNRIAYRDEASGRFMDELDIETEREYVPDIVYALGPDTKPENTAGKVGVALYCNYSGQRREEIFPYVLSELKKTVETLIDEGNTVSLIPMEIPGTSADDRPFAEDIIRSLPEEKRENIRISEPEADGIIKTVDRFAENELIIAYKTHSVVFSAICAVPVVAVAYHPKSIQFMKSLGLEQFAVPDREASAEKLLELVRVIRTCPEEISEKEYSGVENNRKLIRGYIEKLFEQREND